MDEARPGRDSRAAPRPTTPSPASPMGVIAQIDRSEMGPARGAAAPQAASSEPAPGSATGSVVLLTRIYIWRPLIARACRLACEIACGLIMLATLGSVNRVRVQHA